MMRFLSVEIKLAFWGRKLAFWRVKSGFLVVENALFCRNAVNPLFASAKAVSKSEPDG